MKLPRRKFLRLAAGAAALPAMPHVAWAKGTTVIWVHSIYGFRNAIGWQAKLLKDLGHKVYAPDLYQEGGRRGPVFSKLADAQKHAFKLGVFDRKGDFEERLEKNKALRRLADFTKDAGPAVWAGWSVGGLFAQRMAWERAKDPKHRPIGLLLMGQELLKRYEFAVPLHIHAAEPDGFVDEAVLKDLKERGATVHRYPRVGHIFADRRLPDYNKAATDLWWERVKKFLEGFPSAPA